MNLVPVVGGTVYLVPVVGGSIGACAVHILWSVHRVLSTVHINLIYSVAWGGRITLLSMFFTFCTKHLLLVRTKAHGNNRRSVCLPRNKNMSNARYF